MLILFDSIKIPVSVKISIPFLISHCRIGFLLKCGFWCCSLLFEKQNIFKIKLYNTIARIWETAHNSTASGCIHCGGFLPNNLSHKIETYCFAETDNFGMNGNYFISSIINRTGKLVANIDTQTATIVQYAKTFFPNQIQMINIIFVTVIKPDLAVGSIIF